MPEFKNYTRSVSIICLGLGTLFTLFALATLASVLMLFVFQVREPTPELRPAGMFVSMAVTGILGALGVTAFVFRKTVRGWNLSALFGGLLSLLILMLPWLLQGERGGPPVGSIGIVVLSLLGLWVLLTTLDPLIRRERGAEPDAGDRE